MRSTTDAEVSSVSAEAVVEVALHRFAQLGFEDARLETIAQESGMSKRMIHYHFGDKKGLYLAALKLAIAQLRPEPQEMELESTVPVEGVRKVVEVIFNQIIEHPDAVRFMILENLFDHANLSTASPFADQSAVLLQMDKLLMMGQDAGAFRPGISALDVYTIITAICFHHTVYAATYANLYSMDLDEAANINGTLNLVIDAVLAFLTSNLSATGEMSYLTPRSLAADDPAAASVYGDDVESGESETGNYLA